MKPNNLESLWMPFTPNKSFKKDPRIIVGAKDMHFISDDGMSTESKSQRATPCPSHRNQTAGLGSASRLPEDVTARTTAPPMY